MGADISNVVVEFRQVFFDGFGILSEVRIGHQLEMWMRVGVLKLREDKKGEKIV